MTTNNGNEAIREFKKCPACGSEEQFFGDIVKELRARGIVGQDWNFYLDMKQGAVFDERKKATLPIGSKLPGYVFASDICSNCGTIYVVKLQKLMAELSLSPAQIIPAQSIPNRAERRHPFRNN